MNMEWMKVNKVDEGEYRVDEEKPGTGWMEQGGSSVDKEDRVT